MLYSVIVSDGASSPLPLYNNKGNLLTDKIVLPDADNKKKKENDIIIVVKEASKPLTPQVFKRMNK